MERGGRFPEKKGDDAEQGRSACSLSFKISMSSSMKIKSGAMLCALLVSSFPASARRAALGPTNTSDSAGPLGESVTPSTVPSGETWLTTIPHAVR